MMPYTLSLNTNPLVNRFADIDDLIETIAYDIKIRDVQLTHEFINPSWPLKLRIRLYKKLRAACERTGVCITSGMTGPYGRLNHFGHPDPDVRAYYLEWFKIQAQMIAELGGRAIGTQFAIFTYKDFDDLNQRDQLIDIALDCWAELAEYGAGVGLKFLFWEPMSVGREFGETIHGALALQQKIEARNMALPMWMMADIDHGDVNSDDPQDYDPYAWARAVPEKSPIIQIKQSFLDKSGHRPFADHFNKTGLIRPETLLEAFNHGGGRDNEICLELGFKEREPDDRQVITQIAQSVAYWAPFIDTGAKDLKG